jgi:hypothetical protein
MAVAADLDRATDSHFTGIVGRVGLEPTSQGL